jgi:hypothetical protein
MAGVTVSYEADLPSGPVIVVAFAFALILAAIVRTTMVSQTRTRSLMRFAIGAAAIVLVVGVSKKYLSHEDSREVVPYLKSAVKSERLMALGTAGPGRRGLAAGEAAAAAAFKDPKARCARASPPSSRSAARPPRSSVQALLTDPDDHVRETAVRVVRTFGDAKSADPLFAAGGGEEDEYLKVEFGEALLELGDARGFDLLLAVMEKGEAEQSRKDAFEHYSAHAAPVEPFDAGADEKARAAVVAKLRGWLQQNRGTNFDRATRKFAGRDLVGPVVRDREPATDSAPGLQSPRRWPSRPPHEGVVGRAACRWR